MFGSLMKPRNYAYRIVKLRDGGFIAECAPGRFGEQLLTREGVMEWPAVYASALRAMKDSDRWRYVHQDVESAQEAIEVHRSLHDDRNVIWSD